MLKYQQYSLLPEFETNTYLVWDDDSKEAMLIDPSAPSDKLRDFINKHNLTLKFIVNTHGHADHIGGNVFFKANLKTPVAIHVSDADMLPDPKLNLSAYIEINLALPSADMFLKDGDTYELGKHIITVIHTPGHTQGCICLYCDNLLFSGDTLFQHDIGRTDLPSGSYEKIINSVKTRLFTLPGETIVLPGHGASSTIHDEVLHNPYLKGK